MGPMAMGPRRWGAIAAILALALAGGPGPAQTTGTDPTADAVSSDAAAGKTPDAAADATPDATAPGTADAATAAVPAAAAPAADITTGTPVTVLQILTLDQDRLYSNSLFGIHISFGASDRARRDSLLMALADCSKNRGNLLWGSNQ